MSADWGFLSGLSGRKNWDSIDAQKGKELQYQYLLNNEKDQHLKETQEHVAQLQDIYNKANDIEVLEPGRDRIKAVSDQLKESIKQKIKDYGGDFDKYMSVEGMPDAKNYLNTLLNDPVTIREMHNARFVAQNKADQAAGLQSRIDPATGKSFNENLTDYYAGKTDTIPYYGAFKPGKFDDKFFSETYANDKKTPKSVEADEYFSTGVRELMNQGLSQQDAAQQLLPSATAYQRHIQGGGNKLQYKSEKQPSEIDTKLKLMRYELMRDKHLKQIEGQEDSWEAFNSGSNAMGITKSADGQDIYPNQTVDVNSYNSAFGLPTDEKSIGKTTQAAVAATPYSDKAKKSMATLVLGLSPTTGQQKKEEGPGYTGKMLNGNKLYSAVNMQKINGDINDFPFVLRGVDNSVVIKSPPGSGKPDRHMALIHVDLPREAADKLGVWQHNTVFPDRANRASEGAGRQGATSEGKLGRVFSFYVDLDNVPLNIRKGFTKQIQFGNLSNQDIDDYMKEQQEPVQESD